MLREGKEWYEVVPDGVSDVGKEKNYFSHTKVSEVDIIIDEDGHIEMYACR